MSVRPVVVLTEVCPARRGGGGSHYCTFTASLLLCWVKILVPVERGKCEVHELSSRVLLLLWVWFCLCECVCVCLCGCVILFPRPLGKREILRLASSWAAGWESPHDTI